MTEGISIPHFYQHMGISLCLWVFVILAVLIDLWDGVYTAKVVGVRVRSHKFRATVRKIGEYWRFILMGFIADTIGVLFPFWAWPYLSILICLAVIAIECKSVFEHAKKRKSHVADIPAMIQEMVDCATEHDAISLIARIKEMIDDENDKYNHNQGTPVL